MKIRRWTGALLVLAALSACEAGSAVEPSAADARMERRSMPPGLDGNPHVPFDTSDIHTGYFGSGHRRAAPFDSAIVIRG